MNIPEPVQTTATVLATGGVVLGSLWVVATVVVVVSRAVGAARRRKAAEAVPFRLDVVGLPLADREAIRKVAGR